MTASAPARPRSGTMDLDEFLTFLEMRPKEERWHLLNREFTEQRRGLADLHRGSPLRPQQRRSD